MKVVSIHNFGSGCSDLDIEEEIRNGIIAVVWPENSDSFSINPTRKGNGVRPIKYRFMNHISEHGYDVNEWQNPYRFDAFHEKNKIAIEWETGNISSSHRAVNRILLAMKSCEVDEGYLIVPSRKLYHYLTDRIGNEDELKPYFELWKSIFSAIETLDRKCFRIVVIEHDKTSANTPLIPKGKDGMSDLGDNYKRPKA